ncbi:MAG TPA: hypothetical protein EYH58_04985 [Aquifex aeolicus]|nr:hypothetical protein [Aquifex aeolicus]
MNLLTRTIILLAVIVLSAFSFNALTTDKEEASKIYYEIALKALHLNDYEDALVFFSKALSLAPSSKYGELSYLYYGLTYALYSYHLGNKEGIFSAIGYLNQYTFYYKKPEYLILQREFLGDSYLLVAWYEDAMNIYANLYGDTKKKKYLIKYAFISALYGDYTGYNELRRLKSLPKDYLYLYHLALGIYSIDFGRNKEALQHLTKALELNPFLRYDVHFNYYTGLAYYKNGKIWRSMLFFLRAKDLDKFGLYRTMLNYYLTQVYLATNNFSEAYEIYKEIFKEIFYNSIYKVIYSNYWLNEEFLKRYEDFKFYYDVILQIGWLSTGKKIVGYSLLALYNKALKSKNLSEEEKVFMETIKFENTDFVMNKELFSFKKQLDVLNRKLSLMDVEESAEFIVNLYKTHRNNFLTIFYKPDSLFVLARALVYTGDKEFLKIAKLLPNTPELKFLKAKYWFSKGRKEVAKRFLKDSINNLEGIDKLEAMLLLYYLIENPYIDEVLKLAREYKELENYFPYMYRLAGDIYYDKGMYRKALLMYKEFLQNYKAKDDIYGATLVKMGVLAEVLQDKKTVDFVVKEAKGFKNLWSEAILTLWGGS